MSLNENKDLKFIKKHYGEDFAKLCRTLFPTLLEQPGLLSTLVSTHIEPTKSLLDDLKREAEDPEDFVKNFIYSFVDVEQEKPQIIENKTAEEILDEAGYVLYPECKTEEDLQKFKKFYKREEELCSFRGGRLEYCRVWFAVKKNVKDIKRANFSNPKRQDEYGTSVISIQYTKREPSTLSIKNRYNHTVNNPDATFSNNLDNIVPGLKNAFEQQFHIISDKNQIVEDIFPYVQVGGKLFRSNFERSNIYYCSNNVIIDNFEVKRFDKARYIVFENYIIDKKEKTIKLYNNTTNKKEDHDEFTKSFGQIKEVKEIVKKGGRDVIITTESGGDVILGLDDNNVLKEYYNSELKTVGKNFLGSSFNLEKFNAPNLKKAGQGFLCDAENLTSFVAPNLEELGDESLRYVYNLKQIEVPCLKEVGNCVLEYAHSLENFSTPCLEIVLDSFLSKANNLKSFDAPNLKIMRSNVLNETDNLSSINVPNLVEVGSDCLTRQRKLTAFSAPCLRVVGDNFFMLSSCLKSFSAQNLRAAGNYFLSDVTQLKSFYGPKLKKVGNSFLNIVGNLEEFFAPMLETVGYAALEYAASLKSFSAPKLVSAGDGLLRKARKLKKFYAPNLQNAGENFLKSSDLIEEYDCPIVPKHLKEKVNSK